MFAVSKLSEHAKVNAKLGKISICEEPTSAVFDMSAEDALKLVAFAKAQDLKQFSFDITTELPKLQVREKPPHPC